MKFALKRKNEGTLEKMLASMEARTVAKTTLVVGATAAVGAGLYWAMTRKAPRASFRMRREVDAPAKRVLELFTEPERLTSVMEHADIDASERLTWKQEGPLGFTYTWTPTVDVDERAREVHWATDDGSLVDAIGRVSIRPMRNGRSLLEFEADFQVPGPMWPKALHERTRRLVADDLERICMALEAESHPAVAVAEAK